MKRLVVCTRLLGPISKKGSEAMSEETITITKKEYEELSNDSLLLSFLEGHGVDNWQGYDDAISEYRKYLKAEKILLTSGDLPLE